MKRVYLFFILHCAIACIANAQNLVYNYEADSVYFSQISDMSKGWEDNVMTLNLSPEDSTTFSILTEIFLNDCSKSELAVMVEHESKDALDMSSLKNILNFQDPTNRYVEIDAPIKTMVAVTVKYQDKYPEKKEIIGKMLTYYVFHYYSRTINNYMKMVIKANLDANLLEYIIKHPDDVDALCLYHSLRNSSVNTKDLSSMGQKDATYVYEAYLKEKACELGNSNGDETLVKMIKDIEAGKSIFSADSVKLNKMKEWNTKPFTYLMKDLAPARCSTEYNNACEAFFLEHDIQSPIDALLDSWSKGENPDDMKKLREGVNKYTRNNLTKTFYICGVPQRCLKNVKKGMKPSDKIKEIAEIIGGYAEKKDEVKPSATNFCASRYLAWLKYVLKEQ